MKRNTVLRAMYIFLALFCMVSCSKRGGVVDIDDPIVGTWLLTDYTLVSDVATDGGTLNISAEGEEDMEDLLITFHPDGTTSYSGVGFTLAYTVSKDGNPIAEEEMRMQSLVLNGSWKREGDKLIVDYPGYGLDPLEIQIEKLTENELHLAATVEPLMALPESGYTAVTASVDAHFVRTTLSVQHEEERIDDPIVGTWQMVFYMSETTSTSEEGTVVINAKGIHMAEADIRATFHADGTTTVTGDTFTVVYTLSMNGHSTTTEIETKPMLQNGTWKRVGNVLIGDYPGNLLGPQEINITTLTDTDLHVFRSAPSPIPVPGMGDIAIGVHYIRVD